VENLRERLDQSTNPTERAVLAERLRFSEARVANDASAMRSAINGLQAIADENAGDAFGAEALVRAAEYSAEIGEYTVARAFWDEASSRYQSHKEWRDWENRAVSCAIQSGDMLCREGETAVQTSPYGRADSREGSIDPKGLHGAGGGLAKRCRVL
jgi:hypothetical protein